MNTSANLSRMFDLHLNLGLVVVPDDHDPVRYLGDFLKRNDKSMNVIDSRMTDENFPRSSHVLRPGARFRVLAVKGLDPLLKTSSEDRHMWMDAQKAVRVGTPGLLLVWEQKKDLLVQDDFWYISLDVSENLWRDMDGVHWVPHLHPRARSLYRWPFEYMHDHDSAFLCYIPE